MNTKICLLAMIMLFVPFTSAFFTEDHTYWTVTGFNEVDSAITNMCRDRITVVLDGNTAADIPVLHYFDNKYMSYVSTHTRGSGYQECMRLAGSDIDLKCFCVGMGLHETQDFFAHGDGGLVPTYLERYASTNLIGHMTVEKDFQNKHIEYLESIGDPMIASGDLEYYGGENENSQVCVSLFEQTGGDQKYLNLLKDVSGIDMRSDANLFCNGYKGQGFYSTVYDEKVSLPFWVWGICIAAIIVGFGIGIFVLILGEGVWRWITMLEYFIIAILGILLLFSLFTGNTWSIVEGAIEIPSKIGVLSVSQEDVVSYHNQVQVATNEFLRTGVLRYDDSSGRDYVDRNGVYIEGALGESEKFAKLLLWPAIGAVFLIMNVWMFKKTFWGDN